MNNLLVPANWVKLYADSMFSYSMIKTGSRELAEDLVQETFLSAFAGKDNFKGESSEKTWLFSILKNKIIDSYRKKKIETPSSDYIDATNQKFDDSFFNPDNHGRWKEKIGPNYFSKAADSYLYSEEFYGFLNKCLMTMPTKLRQIFIAKYMDDSDTETICKENELTTSNYWVIIYRSKILLRKCLEKKGIMTTNV